MFGARGLKVMSGRDPSAPGVVFILGAGPAVAENARNDQTIGSSGQRNEKAFIG